MTSISQDSGDVAGDIKLSITGTGFTNEDDTLIQIGDKLMICQPTSMSAILMSAPASSNALINSILPLVIRLPAAT